MRGLALVLSFNTLAFQRQWLSLSNVLWQTGERQEGVNEQEMVERKTELMSRRAALVWLPIDTVRPLKKDIVHTCFLAFNNTTLWPICRSFHTTQLTPFPSGGCRCPWKSVFTTACCKITGSFSSVGHCMLTACLCTQGETNPYAVAATKR